VPKNKRWKAWNSTQFLKRTGKKIDFVLLNHGGIRSIISKGNVSSRTAYEIMPFENNIVVVQLKGTTILELIDYLINFNKPHPIAGIQVVLNNDNSLNRATIGNDAIDANKIYTVATSDYLVKGGDNMVFFKNAISITSIDYKIRTALIDYFIRIDTLHSQIDNRFYKLNR